MTTLPWTCWRDGQTYGPYDDSLLRSLAQTGRIRPSDLVSNGGAWVVAVAVPGLFPPGAGAPPPLHAAPPEHTAHAHTAPPTVAAMPVVPLHAPDASHGPANGAPMQGMAPQQTAPAMQGAPAMVPIQLQAAPPALLQSPGAYPLSAAAPQFAAPQFAPVFGMQGAPAGAGMIGAPGMQATMRGPAMALPATAQPQSQRGAARMERHEAAESTWSHVRDRMAPWLLAALLLLVVMWLWGVWNLPVATIPS